MSEHEATVTGEIEGMMFVTPLMPPSEKQELIESLNSIKCPIVSLSDGPLDKFTFLYLHAINKRNIMEDAQIILSIIAKGSWFAQLSQVGQVEIHALPIIHGDDISQDGSEFEGFDHAIVGARAVASFVRAMKAMNAPLKKVLLLGDH